MSIDKQHLELGDRLRAARETAGYRTGKDFAAVLGWEPSKVSRLENARTLPSDSDITDWTDAASVPPEIVADLRSAVRDLRLARDRWKRQLRTGHTPRQKIAAATEHNATRIVQVEYFLVPGLVQTETYARAVFALAADLHHTPADTDNAVRERIRRQEILYDPDKTIEIIISEAALRHPICPVPTLRAQIDRLAAVIGLPNLRLGILPLDTTLPTITMHGYQILDDTVIVEVNHTEITTTDPDDLALYTDITERLWNVAVEGDDARTLLLGISSHLAQSPAPGPERSSIP